MRRFAAALALCAGCASYRLLPLPSASGAMPVRYEKTRLFFHSVEDDGALARVFAGPPTVLATVASPEEGVFASPDGGATWTFSAAPPLDAVLFGRHLLVALAAGRILRSDDEGRSWEGAPAEGPIEAITLGPEGALYAGGPGRLFASADGGRTFRILAPALPAKGFSVRSIAAVPGALLVSLRGEPADPRPPAARLLDVLESTSEEAVAALALVDSRDRSAREVRFGGPATGVYVSRDGGATFRKTGLMIDAFVVARGFTLYAVAADPLVQAAALARSHPELAAAAARHLRGERVAGYMLRGGCAWPGRDRLIAGPFSSVPVFQSADSGASWSRLIDPPLPLLVALREQVESETWEPPLAPAEARQQGAAYRSRGGRRNGAPPQGPQPRSTAASAATMLSFVDPARLLAHFNGGLPLSGASSGFAYAPTEAYWNALVDALAAESDAEGEISLGPGLPDFRGAAAFEVLRAAGAGWQPVPADPPHPPSGIVAYPASIAGAGAQAFFVLSGRGRRGQSWRGGWRIAAP